MDKTRNAIVSVCREMEIIVNIQLFTIQFGRLGVSSMDCKSFEPQRDYYLLDQDRHIVLLVSILYQFAIREPKNRGRSKNDYDFRCLCSRRCQPYLDLHGYQLQDQRRMEYAR